MDNQYQNILTQQTADGISYKIYLPDNYTADTPIVSCNYFGVPENSLLSGIEEQNASVAVILPTISGKPTTDKSYQNAMLSVLNDARSKYGLTSDQFYTVGHSSSISQSIKTTAEYINQNPGVSRQIVFAADPWNRSMANGEYYQANAAYTQEEMNALIQNDTLVVTYGQPQNFNKLTSDITKNLDVLIISDKNQYSSDYYVNHDHFAQDIFKEGVYTNTLDFVNGKGNLDMDKYNYYTYDESGKVVQLNNVDEIYEKFKLQSTSQSVIKPTLGINLSSANVFADLSTLFQWSSNMAAINESAISTLDSLESAIDSLSGSFEGDFSKGFIEDSSKVVKDSKNKHNEMKSLIDGLKVTANVYSEQ